MPRHWLIGEETHFGRGYFSIQRFGQKRAALAYARDEYNLRPAEVEALRAGRVEFFEVPGRAQQVECIALELVGCSCGEPEVHDD
jgi:hypothetical protein